MSTRELTRLAERAEHVTGRAGDRLAEVHSRIRATRRRRTAGAVLGTGALVLALLAGTTLLAGTPEPDPTPDQVVDRGSSGVVRPLTWSDEFWPSRYVHYGDRIIDTGLDLTAHDFATMDLTDDGIVLTTVDGRVWFADGSSVEQIADTHLRSEFLGLLDVRTGSSGSLAAWIQGDQLVVFDTSRDRVVARTPCAERCARITWVGTHSVYWQVDDRRPSRVEVATGEVSPSSQRALRADMLAQGRVLVVGDTFGRGVPTSGVDVTFVREGSRLRAAVPGTTVPETLTSAFDSTGAPVQLRLPDGYDGAASFTSFQWLDDDRLALMAGAGTTGIVFGLRGVPESADGYGDVLVCHVSTGSCRLALRGNRPDRNGDGQADQLRIVPHFGTPGTN